MPGHSYKGSTASNSPAAVFPPTPVGTVDGGSGNWALTVSVAASGAGRPTFEGYVSTSGTGNPTTDPGQWSLATFAANNDGGGNYQTQYVPGDNWFIGRTRYGLNVSGWSNKVGGA